MKTLVRQFRRVAFGQVLLGILAFGVASQNLGLLLIAGALAALAWLIAEGPWGTPLPRWATNLGGLAATLWLAAETLHFRNDLLLAMSHFTLWLQVVLLYSRKSNREYVSLLMLSLLLMAAASVLSVSIVYGVLLALYSALALLSLLLFHFKVTSDGVHERTQAAAGRSMPVEPPDPVAGPRYRLHFRVTSLAVALVCAATAAFVFVLLPRVDDYHVGSLHENRAAMSRRAGLSQRVDVGGGAPTRTSTRPVLHLEVSLNGRDLAGEGAPWRLRSVALDRYDQRTQFWTRGPVREIDQYQHLDAGRVVLADGLGDAGAYRARITHRQPGGSALFSVLPAMEIHSRTLRGVRFNPHDHVLSAAGGWGANSYDVLWPAGGVDNLADHLAERWRLRPPEEFVQWYESGAMGRYGQFFFEADSYARGWPVQRERIARHARQVLARQGLTRPDDAPPRQADVAVAEALADHMRANYRYTLDVPEPLPGQEPLTAFLFQHRQGHCELFASALAAMTRSIGMRARVVTGYLAQDYNQVGGYYLVRESDAHAWVEIDAGPGIGWVTVDPTPAADAPAGGDAPRGWLTAMRDFYEHLEFTWLSSVVTFDETSREAMLGRVQASLSFADGDGEPTGLFAGSIARLRDLGRLLVFDGVSFALAGLIFVGLGLALLTIARLLVVRRRRLATLQLTALPRARRRGLARRLRFYLAMLDMLERHGHIRPPWQSPASFAHELAQTEPLRFDPVVALTDHFYEIRFGHRELNDDRRRRIQAHLKQLEYSLTRS